MWKKQAGMITKKDMHPVEVKKRRKGKSKRHLLTSMTSHIVEKNKEEALE